MGRWTDAEPDLVRCRDMAGPAADPGLYIQLILELVVIRINQGRFADAQVLMDECGKAGIDLDADSRMILAGYQGRLAFCRHDLAAAKDRFQTVLGLALSGGQRDHQSTAQQNLGNIAVQEGDLAAAERYYRDALRLSEQLQDIRGMGYALGSIGICLAEKGDHHGALQCFRSGLDIARRLGELQTVAQVLGNTGQLFHQMGRTAESIVCYTEQLSIVLRIGDARGIYNAQFDLAAAFREQGRHAEADRCYDQAVAHARQHGMMTEAATALLEKAAMASALGRDDVAAAAIGQLFSIAGSVRDPSLLQAAGELRDALGRDGRERDQLSS